MEVRKEKVCDKSRIKEKRRKKVIVEKNAFGEQRTTKMVVCMTVGKDQLDL